MSEQLDQGAFRTWFTVIAVDQPPGRSLYDPDVQLSLENQLSSMRFAQEQDRYIVSLRDRWVADNLNAMLARILTIARLRYLPR